MHNKIFTQRILISLSWIRAAALMMQVLYLLVFISPIRLFVWTLLIVQVCLLLSSWIAQKRQHSEKTVLLHLLLDIVLLGGYIYFTGGTSNPLIYLLLLPLVTAAVALRQSLSLSVLILACLVYSGLYVFEQPQHHHASNYSSHLLGMWLVFVVSGGLLFYVGSYLSQAIRQQQIRIQHHERRQLRNDYLTALGVTAADAAHQLNTPLSTLAVLIEDIEASNDHRKLMQQQIDRCQNITQSIQTQFEELKRSHYKGITSKEFLQQIVGSFRLLQPEVELEIESTLDDVWIRTHVGLESALLNLLDNAAKASQQEGSNKVFLTNTTEEGCCVIRIRDCGRGISKDFIEDYGWRPSHNDASSINARRMGIGTLISNASIEISGGQLSVKNNGSGTTVTISLPQVSAPRRESKESANT